MMSCAANHRILGAVPEHLGGNELEREVLV